MLYYSLPTKLLGANVFNCVCPSFCLQGVGPITNDALDLTVHDFPSVRAPAPPLYSTLPPASDIWWQDWIPVQTYSLKDLTVQVSPTGAGI